MIILQCQCGATIERKYRHPRATCDACQNASFRNWRAAKARSGSENEYKRAWYQANKENIKLARASGLSVPEARRRLAAEGGPA